MQETNTFEISGWSRNSFRDLTDRRKYLAISLSIALLAWVSPAHSATILTVEYNGPGASWIDAGNWLPVYGVYPRNESGLSLEFETLISSPGCPGGGVNFDDISSPAEVNTLTLRSNCRLNILAGTELSIRDDAQMGGLLVASGGNFSATTSGATQASFFDDLAVDNKARIWASAGSVVSIDAPSYSSTGLTANNGSSGSGTLPTWNLFSATNPGTTIDLSAVTAFDAGYPQNSNDNNRQAVYASDGGLVDLSSVSQITPPIYFNDFLQLDVDGAASRILLTSLESISNPGGIGRAYLEITGGASQCLPSMTNLENTQMAANGGSLIAINGGDTDCGGALPVDLAPSVVYNTKGIVFNNGSSGSGTLPTWSLISATNPGSVIDLSAVTVFDAGYPQYSNDNNRQAVYASDGGLVDLSSITAVIPPDYLNDYLRFDTDGANSEILLTALESISNPGGIGRTVVDVSNGAAQCLPSITNVENTQLFASSGSLIAINGGDTDCGGALPVDLTPSVVYNTQGIVFNNGSSGSGTLPTWSLISATNPGSVIDLSAVTVFDAGYPQFSNDNNRQAVSASDGGLVDLSSITAVIPPDYLNDYLRFDTDGANSEILLTALESISNPGGIGRTVVDVSNGAAQCLPSITNVENTQLFASSGSLIAINGGDTDCGGALPVDLTPSVVYNTQGIVFNNGSSGSGTLPTWSLISATNPGSVIDLSAVTVFDAGYPQFSNDNNRQAVSASDGGLVDLSSVAQLIPPLTLNTDWITFSATDGGAIDLIGLQKILGGRVFFNATDASLTLGNLTKATTFAVDLTETGGGTDASLLLTEATQVYGTSTLRPTTASVESRHDIVFDTSDVTTVNLSDTALTFTGDTTHILEVGGLDATNLCFLLADTNFGIGQLVIGDGVDPAAVMLMDLLDNGHTGGGGGDEALYLFGPGTGSVCARSGGDGLVIAANSTLYLNDEDAYVYDDGLGSLVHLNSLFPGPVDPNCIQDYGGTICLSGAPMADADADLVADSEDNCLQVPNGPYEASARIDVDHDGIGQACDPDYDQNGLVTSTDFSVFISEFGGLGLRADHDGNGSVTSTDFAVFLAYLGEPPGPSGLACADPTIRLLEGDTPCDTP